MSHPLVRVLLLSLVVCASVAAVISGCAQAPKGVVLETPDQIAAQAPKIGETVGNRYMPIGNLTQMTDAERALVTAWVAQGAHTR